MPKNRPPDAAAVVRSIVRAHHPKTSAATSPAEQKARAALEARQGRPFTDEEWREAETNLVALFIVASDWAANPLPPTDANEKGARREAD